MKCSLLTFLKPLLLTSLPAFEGDRSIQCGEAGIGSSFCKTGFLRTLLSSIKENVRLLSGRLWRTTIIFNCNYKLNQRQNYLEFFFFRPKYILTPITIYIYFKTRCLVLIFMDCAYLIFSQTCAVNIRSALFNLVEKRVNTLRSLLNQGETNKK